MTRKTVLFVLVGMLYSGAVHADDNQPQTSPGALAALTLEARMFLLDPLPENAQGAVSGWFYTLTAPDFYLTDATLEENLASNAQKFCAGGKWKPLHKKFESRRIEFSFACYDQKAIIFKNAAIAQGMPRGALR